MIDPIATAARAAASRLTDTYGQGLAAEVESALHTRGPVDRPDQYLDLVSLGGLIVSIATLAWTVYTDRRSKTGESTPDAIANTISIEFCGLDDAVADAASRNHMIEIIVSETLRAAGHGEPASDDGAGPTMPPP